VTRRKLDAYYTPDHVAAACVDTLGDVLVGATVIEPSAGGGAFVRALQRAQPARIIAIDVDPEAPILVEPPDGVETMCGNFTALDTSMGTAYTRRWWVVGNPPYGNAEAHVRAALAIAEATNGGVAMLLRLAFLESQQRADFWDRYPLHELHPLTQRPSFTGGRTDSCAYGWFVWRFDVPPTDAIRPLRWSQ
jgi:hypothetical protein